MQRTKTPTPEQRMNAFRAFARLIIDAPEPHAEGTDVNLAEFNLSTAEAAARLGRSQSFVYQLMRDNKLEGRKLGGRWRVRSKDIDAILDSAQSSTSAASDKE